MDFAIRPAAFSDWPAIRGLYADLNRPKRRVRVSEYLVAVSASRLIGCAAVRLFRGGGYLYGLAVRRECQRRGAGRQLTLARIERIRASGASGAVVMAMFWNTGFFRKLGFATVRRDVLPAAALRLGDFRNPLYKRSAILWRTLEP
jgi:N-acetylglutamate synthase-like GNAT family acetyltransferase